MLCLRCVCSLCRTHTGGATRKRGGGVCDTSKSHVHGEPMGKMGQNVLKKVPCRDRCENRHIGGPPKSSESAPVAKTPRSFLGEPFIPRARG